MSDHPPGSNATTPPHPQSSPPRPRRDPIENLSHVGFQVANLMGTLIKSGTSVGAQLWVDSSRLVIDGALKAASTFFPYPSDSSAPTYSARARWFRTPDRLRVDDFIQRTDTPGNVGVCFSGGGSRAMVAAMGQLRGLRALGLLGKVKALSTVSGGSWATIPYTYLPEGFSDDDLLNGFVLEPASLAFSTSGGADRAALLDYLPEGNLGRIAADPGMSAVSLCTEATWLRTVGEVPAHRIWTRLVGNHVLKPYGLAAFDDSGLPTSFFAYDAAAAAEIRERNPSLPAECHVYRQPADSGDRRPFHICNASMFVRPQSGANIPTGKGQLLAPLQSTAFFTGLLGTGLGTDRAGAHTGGGAVESFAANSVVSQVLDENWVDVLQSSALALADVTGMSSAFFAPIFSLYVPALGTMDPEYLYWSPDPPTEGAGHRNAFADGGGVDDNGVASLLVYEDIDNVVAFVNSTPSSKDRFGNLIVDWVPPLFGFAAYQAGKTAETTGYFSFRDVARNPSLVTKEYNLYSQHNQVFPSEAFAPLLEALWANSGSGSHESPSVALQTQIDVLANPWFGVRGGRKVNVLWFILNPVESWNRRLSPEVRSYLRHDFPNYNMFATHLSAEQVNLLAHHTSWVVHQNGDALRKMFAPAP